MQLVLYAYNLAIPIKIDLIDCKVWIKGSKVDVVIRFVLKKEFRLSKPDKEPDPIPQVQIPTMVWLCAILLEQTNCLCNAMQLQ